MGKVMHVVHRKPRMDDSQQQHPVRDNKTGLWTCPWCHRSDFAELSEVGNTSLFGWRENC